MSTTCEFVISSGEAAVAFVDLSGFTALTEVHGDHLAAETAETFAQLVRDVLSPEDRLVKTIGDAVLLTSPTRLSAVQLVQRIVTVAEGVTWLPMLRAGVSYGPVAFTSTDVYGATVNVAARVAATAEPGQLLLTGSPPDFAERAGLHFASLGSAELKNIAHPVQIFSAVLDEHGHRAHVDPVCRMHITAQSIATAVIYRGRYHRFCSLTCGKQFMEQPHEFVRAVGHVAAAP
ncbi:adenylate/guanylate cyclase domain-containing protein [Mycobacterium asiaticum]|uniref:Guanylate cyclase domain-containing protein n=1 Tax=Mycobacterium asiaticum TaxID=1790 RepID=A0A1A3KTF4_MYCAS|nr:adenylate/guanylate cyclase domain-containing protein [Mycobacterium asiaticum]OBJ87226.1 hypothetical protein A5640_08160 [Mycobacterium asiaticum]